MNHSSLDCTATINFLLHVVLSSYQGLLSQSFQIPFASSDCGRKDTSCSTLWELHTLAFSMIFDALSKNAYSISADTWQFSLEVCRFFQLVHEKLVVS